MSRPTAFSNLYTGVGNTGVVTKTLDLMTPSQAVEIFRTVFENMDRPLWLYPGETIAFYESTLAVTEASSDSFGVVVSLLDRHGTTLRSTVSQVYGQFLRYKPHRRSIVQHYALNFIRGAFIYRKLRPNRELLSPELKSILALALESMEDTSAIPVLGDAVIQADWFDVRVITAFLSRDVDAISERELHFHIAADAQDPKTGTGPWATIKRNWARSVASLLLFAEWPTDIPPVVHRCWVPDRYDGIDDDNWEDYDDPNGRDD